jgi:predicted nucleotidyltransferase
MNLNDLYEKSNHAAFCFGRLNPPTLGHKQLLDTVAQAGQGNYYIFLSQTHKLPDNPLSYEEKVKFVKAMFPEHSSHVVTGPSLNTIMKVAAWVYNQDVRSVSFVAGSDRLEDFKSLLDKYNGYGEPGQESYYKFDTINYVSSGERDPDAEGVAGYSASKARAAASDDDFEMFKEVTGAGKLAKNLYDAVRAAQSAAPVKKPSAKKTKPVTEDEIGSSQNDIKELFGKFLPLAAKYLGLKKLPKINIEMTLPAHDGQASFGGYNSNTREINLAIANRHPVDIFRTLAHELVHFKQDMLGKIKDHSGETGSSEENQANTVAGIIMRLFNKEYPDAMNAKIITVGAENVEEDVVDDTVQYHDTLEPNIWQDEVLKPEVRNRLLTIAKEFIDSLNIKDFDARDIVLTGSMANYNYTKFSDFDLHVITEYDSLKCAEIAEEFYQSKKRIWNSSYDIQIAGHDVELYVEDEDDPPVSGGVYSILDNKWIKEPPHQSPDVDVRAVRAKTREYIKKIHDALNGHLDSVKIQELVKKLRDMRTAGLEKAGEFSVENLAYKTLRNAGILDRLSDLRVNHINTDLSL